MPKSSLLMKTLYFGTAFFFSWFPQYLDHVELFSAMAACKTCLVEHEPGARKWIIMAQKKHTSKIQRQECMCVCWTCTWLCVSVCVLPMFWALCFFLQFNRSIQPSGLWRNRWLLLVSIKTINITLMKAANFSSSPKTHQINLPILPQWGDEQEGLQMKPSNVFSSTY